MCETKDANVGTTFQDMHKNVNSSLKYFQLNTGVLLHTLRCFEYVQVPARLRCVSVLRVDEPTAVRRLRALSVRGQCESSSLVS